MSSPTQRSLKRLRDQGYLVAVVEKFNSFTKRRIDLWGFGDLLAIKGNETMIIQSTSGTNVSARVNKIVQEPAIHDVAVFWLESPNRTIQIHGWRKGGPRGKRKTWMCRVLEGRMDGGQLNFAEISAYNTNAEKEEPNVKCAKIGGNYETEREKAPLNFPVPTASDGLPLVGE